MKIAVLFLNYGPYHFARVQALSEASRGRCRVLGIEVAPSSNTYNWERRDVATAFEFISLFPIAHAAETVPAYRQIMAMWRCLAQHSPDVVVLAGYRDPVNLTAWLWAKVNRRLAIMMSESKKDDLSRTPLGEWVKSFIVRGCRAALVGGIQQREYMQELGMPLTSIFLGYDVIDNHYYQERADAARAQAGTCRSSLGLPENYFLSVSRFAPKKNLFRLLTAYKKYRGSSTAPWDLVLAGGGPLEGDLKHYASDIEGVHFPGFKQVDELPAYYGLAKCFVMPSSHKEPWGLVVNEAMASGLPVLVSQACGCAINLVEDGVNGFLLDPYDVDGMARLMRKMSSGEVDLEAMGQASRRIIAHWTPETFATNLFRAVNAAGSAR